MSDPVITPRNGILGTEDSGAGKYFVEVAYDANKFAIASGQLAVKPNSLTDGDVAAANKDGVAGTPSMRTLGVGAQQAAAGNHSHGPILLWRGNWSNASAYALNDEVLNASAAFVCILAHSATATTPDADATHWAALGGGVADGSITNAKVNAAAAIDGTKINPNFGTQIVQGGGLNSTGDISATLGALFSGQQDSAPGAEDGSSGQLLMIGAVSGNQSSWRADPNTDTVALKMPVTLAGAADKFLLTDASGNTSFATPIPPAGSISTSMLADAAVTPAKLATPAPNAQTGTAYTAAAGDAQNVVTMSNAAANVFSIPTHAAVAFPIGTQILVASLGAGLTTISAVTPGTTTIYSADGTPAAPTIALRYSMARLTKLATDTWLVSEAQFGTLLKNFANVMTVPQASVPLTLRTVENPGRTLAFIPDAGGGNEAVIQVGSQFGLSINGGVSTIIRNNGDQFIYMYQNRISLKMPTAFQNLTTTQRTALAPSAGDTVYDTTLNKVFTFDGTAWQAHW